VTIAIGDIVWFWSHTSASWEKEEDKAWGYITKIDKRIVHIRTLKENNTEVLFLSLKGNHWDNAN